MKRMLLLLRATLAGGILFLVPIIVAVIIIEKALSLTDKAVTPVAAHMPIESIIGLRTPKILAVGLIILFCFLAGFFAQTAIARKIANWLDAALLSNLPGYEFFRSIGERILGVETREVHLAVLVRFDDNYQVGFVADRLANGLVAVYVPGAPNPHSGGLVFVTSDRVMPTTVPPQQMLKCLKRLGVGSNALLGNLGIPQDVSK